MIKKVFSWFESRIETYPEAVSLSPTKGLHPLKWSATDGERKWIVILGLMTAGVGIIEALLCQLRGKVVAWLGTYTPDTLLAG